MSNRAAAVVLGAALTLLADASALAQPELGQTPARRVTMVDPNTGVRHDVVLEFTTVNNKDRFSALIGFLNANKKDDGGLYTRFLEAAPTEQKLRYIYWDHLEAIIRGRRSGKFDPDGKWIKNELGKLPPKELYAVAMMETIRQRIMEKLGGSGSGVGNWKQTTKQTYGKWLLLFGVAGIYTYCTAADGGTKCYERAETARDEIHKLIIPPNSRYRSWMVTAIQANPDNKSKAIEDVWDNVKNWFNQHSVACATYNGEGGSLELVIDAWDDKITPAYIWWWWWDQPMHQGLTKAGKDFCGSNYNQLHNAREKGLKELAQRGEELSKKR